MLSEVLFGEKKCETSQKFCLNVYSFLYTQDIDSICNDLLIRMYAKTHNKNWSLNHEFDF